MMKFDEPFNLPDCLTQVPQSLILLTLWEAGVESQLERLGAAQSLDRL